MTKKKLMVSSTVYGVEDLLEQLAEIDIDVIELEKEYSGIMSKQQSEPRYYYISIRFNLL